MGRGVGSGQERVMFRVRSGRDAARVGMAR